MPIWEVRTWYGKFLLAAEGLVITYQKGEGNGKANGKEIAEEKNET